MRNKTFEVNVNLKSPELEQKLDTIITMLVASQKRETEMAADFTALSAEVAGMADTVASGLVVLDSIADALEEANVDNQPQIDELTTSLRAARQALADGIASPGTEEPPPVEEPTP